MSRNIRCIFSVAKSEFLNWITNPRIIIVGVLLIFMYTLAVEPLLEHVSKMGIPLNVLEPFLAIGNSGMLVMLMPCVFMVLISDYPHMTGAAIFQIHRTGKINLIIGQIVFVIMAIISFVSIVLLGSILLSKGKFIQTWSDVVTKYSSQFPNESDSFTTALLPSNLYNQIPIHKALMHTLILMISYLFVLSMIIYFFKLINAHAAGLLFSSFIVAAGVVTCSLKSKIMWLFPMANTIVWLHFDEILRKPKEPIWYSYLYFGIICLILLVLNCVLAKRMQIINLEQVD